MTAAAGESDELSPYIELVAAIAPLLII